MHGLPRRFNDTLAVLIVLGVFIMWTQFELPDQVTGATIVLLTLIGQHYYRKRGGDDQPPQPPVPHG